MQQFGGLTASVHRKRVEIGPGQLSCTGAVRLGMRRSFQTGLTVILIAVALLCGIPVAAAAYQAGAPDYQCAISQHIPDGAVRELGASGTFSVWPIGLECRYFDATGSDLVVSPGWFATGLGIGSLTALVVLTLLSIVALVRSLQSRSRVLDLPSGYEPSR